MRRYRERIYVDDIMDNEYTPLPVSDEEREHIRKLWERPVVKRDCPGLADLVVAYTVHVRDLLVARAAATVNHDPGDEDRS